MRNFALRDRPCFAWLRTLADLESTDQLPIVVLELRLICLLLGPMSRTLAWEYLSPVHVNRLQPMTDRQSVRQVLLDADKDSGANYFGGLSGPQTEVLVDLMYHLLRFAKQQAMTGEKQSTLVSIVYHLHHSSMEAKASMKDAFALLEDLLVSHSVHRPPYSAAVFAVDDVKLILDFLLSTYFRHYKLYLFTFARRSQLHFKAHSYAELNETVPIVTPLHKAIPLAQWQEKQSEIKRKEEETQRKLRDEEDARKREIERQRAVEAAGPQMPEGLKAQLHSIKDNVGKKSSEKIEELEAKVAALESRLSQDAHKPASAVGKGKPGTKR